MDRETYSSIPSYEGESVSTKKTSLSKSQKAMMLLAAISTFLLIALANHASSKSSTSSTTTTSSTVSTSSDLMFVVTNDDYEQPDSLSLYGYDFVAEPHKTTTVAITNQVSDDSIFYWSLEEDGETTGSLEDETFEFSCSTAGSAMTLTVTEYDGSDISTSTTRKLKEGEDPKSYAAPMSSYSSLRSSSVGENYDWLVVCDGFCG